MYDGSKSINGTWSTVWLDDEEVVEATSLSAKIEFKKEDVNILRRMSAGKKTVGWEGKGTLKANHVTSRFFLKVRDNLKAGKQTICTIISKLADPDAYGAERIALKYVTFDDITLADWEAKKQGEMSIPFTFEDFEGLDTIDPKSIS